ncbi:unnamed protein product [Caretta caretta]
MTVMEILFNHCFQGCLSLKQGSKGAAASTTENRVWKGREGSEEELSKQPQRSKERIGGRQGERRRKPRHRRSLTSS